MTIIMHDAVAELPPVPLQAYSKGHLYDVLYADDTLILGTSAHDVETLAASVERIGRTFGLMLHWDKTQALSICTSDRICSPDGTAIPEKGALQYLGATIYGDGRADSELSRKLGAARADFQKLQRLWSHANVPRKDKVQYFHALVVSRLIYGLSSLWLVTAQRRRLDGFYARCLRRIFRIPPAFLSRVSNTKVFTQADVVPISDQLLLSQLTLLGKVARSPDGGPLKRDTFVPGTLRPQVGSTLRRVGRPRQTWTEELLKAGEAKLGAQKLHAMLAHTSKGAQPRWKNELRRAVASSCI
jgi:hypothetical protein